MEPDEVITVHKTHPKCWLKQPQLDTVRLRIEKFSQFSGTSQVLNPSCSIEPVM